MLALYISGGSDVYITFETYDYNADTYVFYIDANIDLIIGANGIYIPETYAEEGIESTYVAAWAGYYTFATYDEQAKITIIRDGTIVAVLGDGNNSYSAELSEGEALTLIFATQSGHALAYDVYLSYFAETQIPALVLGTNSISLDSTAAVSGVESSFITPEEGDYYFEINAEGVGLVYMTFADGTEIILGESIYSATKTLGAGETVICIFKTSTGEAGGYSFGIFYVADEGNILTAGTYSITLTEEDAYYGIYIDYKVTISGVYTFSIAYPDAYVDINVNGDFVYNLNEDEPVYSALLYDGDVVTLVYMTYSGEPATYDVQVSYSEEESSTDFLPTGWLTINLTEDNARLGVEESYIVEKTGTYTFVILSSQDGFVDIFLNNSYLYTLSPDDNEYTALLNEGDHIIFTFMSESGAAATYYFGISFEEYTYNPGTHITELVIGENTIYVAGVDESTGLAGDFSIILDITETATYSFTISSTENAYVYIYDSDYTFAEELTSRRLSVEMELTAGQQIVFYFAAEDYESQVEFTFTIEKLS